LLPISTAWPELRYERTGSDVNTPLR